MQGSASAPALLANGRPSNQFADIPKEVRARPSPRSAATSHRSVLKVRDWLIIIVGSCTTYLEPPRLQAWSKRKKRTANRAAGGQGRGTKDKYGYMPAATEPKVLVPFVSNAGQPPRKVAIARTVRLYTQQDVEQLLRERGVDLRQGQLNGLCGRF